MSIIIDLVIVAIIALCILIGYHKGLTGSLLKIVSFVLALIIAFILFKPVSNFIINKTDWDENLEQAIKQSFLKQEEQKPEEEKTQENMPDVITNYINESVEKAGNEAKTAIVESTILDKIAASVTSSHGGASTIIMSHCDESLSNNLCICGVIRSSDGFGGTFPAEITYKPSISVLCTYFSMSDNSAFLSFSAR